MMLRSQAKTTSNAPVDTRQKRKQDAFDIVKNPSEPAAKKQLNKGLSELSNGISDFLIDSTKRSTQAVSKKGNEENIRPIPVKDADQVIVLDEHADELELASDPTDPCPHYDYDQEEAHNPESVSAFAMDIFKYYKAREKSFRVHDYMAQHPDLDIRTRAILIDWLVEMQESFELNHETLYNAVKLVDMFLANSRGVTKDRIQILACAAVFIAAKYDERSPPLVDDLIYLAGDRFDRDDLLAMERELFSVVGFDLGSPLSYRYLRRLGRVCRVDMTALTLARYILETSLLVFDYSLVAGSRMASAAFLLALKMKNPSGYEWNPILQKYSGYTGEDILPLMEHLNHTMHFITFKWTQLANIREKYSHEVFFEAALTPLLPDTLAHEDNIPDLPVMSFP